jgi:cytochrome b561
LKAAPDPLHAGKAGLHVSRANIRMVIKDTPSGYGLVSRLFHWLMALAIFAMFGLGWWMVGLDYYSAYYHSAPDLHRSVGILLLIMLALRIVWRLMNIKPDDAELTPLERRASRIVHLGFYPLLLALMLSGYFISTPEGRAIDVFGLFSVPSLIQQKGLADTAGFVHRWVAYAVMAVAAVHAIAALKHHFNGGSRILTRMWSGPPAP